MCGNLRQNASNAAGPCETVDEVEIGATPGTPGVSMSFEGSEKHKDRCLDLLLLRHAPEKFLTERKPPVANAPACA